MTNLTGVGLVKFQQFALELLPQTNENQSILQETSQGAWD